jgi:hypothetical protein
VYEEAVNPESAKDSGRYPAALSIQRALADINRKNADSGKPALNMIYDFQ